MPIDAWFPTFVYSERLRGSSLTTFNQDLAEECYQIKDYDLEGQEWSEDNYLGGYTSYSSMAELHRFSSSFEKLQKLIDKHVKAFATHLEYDLSGRELEMTDCWLNIMPASTVHTSHIHPLSTISGTYYVHTPKNCSAIKFEDPRLDKMMAAPPKKAKHSKQARSIVEYPARAGRVVLFESWLRHEVPPANTDEDRISVSFNYNWF